VPGPAVTLRPQRPSDLPLLVGGDTPFDDFGPMAQGVHPAPSRMDDAGALTVVDEAGQVAGDISWHWRGWGPNAGSRCVMIGIWLRPEHRGRGLGRLAQRRLAEMFFTHTRVNRVEAHTDVDNVGEQRALEAAGFSREGRTRGAQWRDGTYHDGYLYAVLRADLDPA
jgi:RimJ/RimL family protein N-acetyltransferase